MAKSTIFDMIGEPIGMQSLAMQPFFLKYKDGYVWGNRKMVSINDKNLIDYFGIYFFETMVEEDKCYFIEAKKSRIRILDKGQTINYHINLLNELEEVTSSTEKKQITFPLQIEGVDPSGGVRRYICDRVKGDFQDPDYLLAVECSRLDYLMSLNPKGKIYLPKDRKFLAFFKEDNEPFGVLALSKQKLEEIK